MIKVLFVCHGNICRSTMAQFVMQYLVQGTQIENNILIDSKGTSNEEHGNPPHYGTVKKLNSVGIPVLPHRASQITKNDYNTFDYIIGMERYNISNIIRITGSDVQHKIYRLMDFTENPCDIDDPWYTGDFDTTYTQIRKGCQALLEYLLKQNNNN